MEIKITADKKILDVLERIAAALTAAPSIQTTPVTLPEAPAAEAPKATTAPPEPVAETPKPEAPKVEAPSREEVQSLAVARIQGGKRDAVKALIAKYGATRVSGVTDDKLAGFKAELEAL